VREETHAKKVVSFQQKSKDTDVQRERQHTQELQQKQKAAYMAKEQAQAKADAKDKAEAAQNKVNATAKAEEAAQDLLEAQDKLCEVCYENENCVEFHPCGHYTCHDCAVKWRQKTVMKAQQGTTCPYCREIIVTISRRTHVGTTTEPPVAWR
jgi:hypothetical protein